MSSPDRYAVFGHPIGHSKSPRIHGLFAEQTGQNLQYIAQDVPADAFANCLAEFLEQGGRGLNCTIPLKELAWRAAGRCSKRAELAKAVNTLVVEANGGLFGDNTDGVGLVRDVCVNLGLALAGKRLLLLGAGGAGRGILQPLLDEGPDGLVIANRTVGKAEQLVREFAGVDERGAPPLCASGFADLTGQRFDVIINATAASLQGDLPPLPADVLEPGGACYDLAYGTVPTTFLCWGREHGAAVSADGLGMLVEQAAEAFWLWRGVRPDTAPVIRLLSAERGF